MNIFNTILIYIGAIIGYCILFGTIATIGTYFSKKADFYESLQKFMKFLSISAPNESEEEKIRKTLRVIKGEKKNGDGGENPTG